jgi:hypothetical protein
VNENAILNFSFAAEFQKIQCPSQMHMAPYFENQARERELPVSPGLQFRRIVARVHCRFAIQTGIAEA